MKTHNYQKIYRVVISLEGQYSIWSNTKEIPYGWREVSKAGTKEECLWYINEVWVDMKYVTY